MGNNTWGKVVLETERLYLREMTESDFAVHLWTSGVPDPDVIVRTGGEYRLSNFMIWQAAYSEFWYSDVLWPDFKSKHLDMAIIDFQKRNRRFGGV